MKKIIRIIAFILSICTVVVCCTGCKFLDKMKDERAFWTNNRHIIYKDVRYKPFPFSEMFNPDIDEKSKNIFVADDDIPLLLLRNIGTEFILTNDEIFLVDFYYYKTGQGGVEVIYCREDRYEEFAEKLENAVAEELCYEVMYISPEQMVATDDYFLTEEQREAVFSIEKNYEPLDVPEGVVFEYDYCVYLEGTTKDGLFRKEFGDIFVKGDTYYLTIYAPDPNGKEVEVVPSETSNIYLVPDELKETFEKILEPAKIGDESLMHDNEFFY